MERTSLIRIKEKKVKDYVLSDYVKCKDKHKAAE